MKRLQANKKKAVYKRDGKVCRFCGTTMNLTIDHVVPVSKGGTHDLKNLRVLCRSCNGARGNYNPNWIEKILWFFFSRREANALRNEMKSWLPPIRNQIETARTEAQQLNQDTRKKFAEVADLMKYDYRKVGSAGYIRDERLLTNFTLLAERLEAMEKYLKVEFVEAKEYRKCGQKPSKTST